MQLTYVTSDFYLAAYLRAQGMTLKEPLREGRRTTFVFEEREDRQDLIGEFYNNGTVSVNAFTHAIQDLKSIIYNW